MPVNKRPNLCLTDVIPAHGVDKRLKKNGGPGRPAHFDKRLKKNGGPGIPAGNRERQPGVVREPKVRTPRAPKGAKIIAWGGALRAYGGPVLVPIEDTRVFAHKQHLVHLASSAGDSVYRSRGIGTLAALEMLTRSKQAHPNAINVIYGGNVVVNLILSQLDHETLRELIKQEGQRPVENLGYNLYWVPRRWFQVGRVGFNPITGKPWPNIRLWDVKGFFQSSLLEALEKWLPDLDREAVRRGLPERLAAVATLMETMEAAVKSAGLSINRRDGAGSIATAMLMKHDVKESIVEGPPEVEQAGLRAYFGGRAEIGMIGRHTGPVYDYDINSAYAAAAIGMPSLANGAWKHTRRVESLEKLEPFSMVLLHWEATKVPKERIFRVDLASKDKTPQKIVEWYATPQAFYPLPFRTRLAHAFYPGNGYGWYWLPEAKMAMDLAAQLRISVRLLEAWEFVAGKDRPFGFICDYYEERKAAKRAGENGKQVVIKLGLAAISGKLAQHVGFNRETGERPPYRSLLYAGYMTSWVRARVMRAVALDPEAVIEICVDGLLTTRPLSLLCSEHLGGWSVDCYDGGILAVRPGYHYLRDNGLWFQKSSGLAHFTGAGSDDGERSIDVQRQCGEEVDRILDAWGKNESYIMSPIERFAGADVVVQGEPWRRYWGWWFSEDIELRWRGNLYDNRTKNRQLRRAVTELLPTRPSLNIDWAPPRKDDEHDPLGCMSWPYDPDTEYTSEDREKARSSEDLEE